MNKIIQSVLSLMLLSTSIATGQNVFPASGNVGIGTLNPSFTLDIAGSVRATEIFIGGSPVQSSPWNLNGNNIFYSLGNIGLGTDSPAYTLDVNGTLNATNILLNGSPLDNSPSPWTLNGANTFYNAGNVGIGTDSPAYALDVNGSLNATGILLNGSPIDNTPSPWVVSGSDLSYSTGNIGIGTSNTQGYRLAVAGNIIAEAVKVELQGSWPDYVFERDYDLLSLSKIESYIKQHGHLPNIPSADEVKREGIQLGEMDAMLLRKIEELTLHAIQQQKEIDHLKGLNENLIQQNKQIESLLERLQKLENSSMEK